MVAALVESHYCLAFRILAYGELALAAIAFLLGTALHKLAQLERRQVHSFSQQSIHLCVSEVLLVVVLNHTAKVSFFRLDLLRVRKSVQRFNYILYLGGQHFSPFLLTRHHFPLLGRTRALLNGQELSLG